MKQLIDTLATLQRIRQKSVQDATVELAQQVQKRHRFDNNIKALGMLMQKTAIESPAPNAASLKNIAGYKGSLQRVMNWQVEERALAQVKEKHIQQSLTAAACEEKVVAITLDENERDRLRQSTTTQQKICDDVAVQCWLRWQGK